MCVTGLSLHCSTTCSSSSIITTEKSKVDETICDVGDARSGVDGDIEEWVEVNEGYEEVNEADEYGRDDDMSDPSLGLGDKENDVEGEEDDIDDDVEFIPFPESMVMVESN
ncbi:hypothetical protein D1007_40656 [Hordeum vulgare]|nr:hypothetical protein D1007_40656 [Hordeum vulgare]